MHKNLGFWLFCGEGVGGPDRFRFGSLERLFGDVFERGPGRHKGDRLVDHWWTQCGLQDQAGYCADAGADHKIEHATRPSRV